MSKPITSPNQLFSSQLQLLLYEYLSTFIAEKKGSSQVDQILISACYLRPDQKEQIYHLSTAKADNLRQNLMETTDDIPNWINPSIFRIIAQNLYHDDSFSDAKLDTITTDKLHDIARDDTVSAKMYSTDFDEWFTLNFEKFWPTSDSSTTIWLKLTNILRFTALSIMICIKSRNEKTDGNVLTTIEYVIEHAIDALLGHNCNQELEDDGGWRVPNPKNSPGSRSSWSIIDEGSNASSATSGEFNTDFTQKYAVVESTSVVQTTERENVFDIESFKDKVSSTDRISASIQGVDLEMPVIKSVEESESIAIKVVEGISEETKLRADANLHTSHKSIEDVKNLIEAASSGDIRDYTVTNDQLMLQSDSVSVADATTVYQGFRTGVEVEEPLTPTIDVSVNPVHVSSESVDLVVQDLESDNQKDEEVMGDLNNDVTEYDDKKSCSSKSSGKQSNQSIISTDECLDGQATPVLEMYSSTVVNQSSTIENLTKNQQDNASIGCNNDYTKYMAIGALAAGLAAMTYLKLK